MKPHTHKHINNAHTHIYYIHTHLNTHINTCIYVSRNNDCTIIINRSETMWGTKVLMTLTFMLPSLRVRSWTRSFLIRSLHRQQFARLQVIQFIHNIQEQAHQHSHASTQTFRPEKYSLTLVTKNNSPTNTHLATRSMCLGHSIFPARIFS